MLDSHQKEIAPHWKTPEISYRVEKCRRDHWNDPRLKRLFEIAYDETKFGKFNPDVSEYIRLQVAGRLVFVVAYLGSMPVGYTFHSIWPHYNDQKLLMAQRRSQCVLPEYRGRGIATKMLELSHRELRRRGVHKVLLNDRGLHRDYFRKIGYDRLETVWCKDL